VSREQVPRIALSAGSVRTWSAMERSARFLGEGFYCRSEVFITSVAFYFGCIFLFMMWFQLSQPRIQDYYAALGYASLLIFCEFRSLQYSFDQ
jgi:hypothetical protein